MLSKNNLVFIISVIIHHYHLSSPIWWNDWFTFDGCNSMKIPAKNIFGKGSRCSKWCKCSSVSAEWAGKNWVIIEFFIVILWIRWRVWDDVSWPNLLGLWNTEGVHVESANCWNIIHNLIISSCLHLKPFSVLL